MKLRKYFFIILLVSCQPQRNEQNIVDETSPMQKNEVLTDSIENFDKFYNQFIIDDSFQSSRIKYPLNGEFYDGSMQDTEDVSHIWTEKDSLNYKTLELDTSQFKLVRPFVSDTLVIEKIFIPNSGFETQVHFKRLKGLWYLVYYSSING
jgi:hypothetical protein